MPRLSVPDPASLRPLKRTRGRLSAADARPAGHRWSQCAAVALVSSQQHVTPRQNKGTPILRSIFVCHWHVVSGSASKIAHYMHLGEVSIPIPIPIPTLYYGNRSTSARVFLRGATPLATVCHGALPRAREGPWCAISSPAQLHGLCIWMPKALATELGPRTVASRSCAVPTWHAVPASGWCCRRQPAPCTPPRCFELTVLKAFAR